MHDNLRRTVKLSSLQSGGIKGSGVDHFLMETWDQILRNIEDPAAATSLISIAFSKAFNRMDHSACLRALREAGVQEKWVNIAAAFLHGGTMSVHVNDTSLAPRSVPGGSP